MKKIIYMLTAALTAASLAMFHVSAENSLSKEEIKSAIWEDFWHGRGDNGKEFPEASYKHHLLDKWVDEHYNDEVYSTTGEWNYEYKRYYSALMEDWLFSDDNNGNWHITDENGNVYGFNYSNGNWQQSDQNGNVIDTFPPYSTIEGSINVPNDNGGIVVKGEMPNNGNQTLSDSHLGADSKSPYDSTETSPNAHSELTEQADDNSISPVVYVLAAAVFVGGITIIIIAVKRRK